MSSQGGLADEHLAHDRLVRRAGSVRRLGRADGREHRADDHDVGRGAAADPACRRARGPPGALRAEQQPEAGHGTDGGVACSSRAVLGHGPGRLVPRPGGVRPERAGLERRRGVPRSWNARRGQRDVRVPGVPGDPQAPRPGPLSAGGVGGVAVVGDGELRLRVHLHATT